MSGHPRLLLCALFSVLGFLGSPSQIEGAQIPANSPSKVEDERERMPDDFVVKRVAALAPAEGVHHLIRRVSASTSGTATGFSSPARGEVPQSDGGEGVFIRKAKAATSGTAITKLQDVPVGKVIQVGFVKFVKAADDAYIATDKVECPDKSWFAGKYVKCWDSESQYTQACTGSNYCYYGTTWIETLRKCVPISDFDGSMQTYSKALCDQVDTPTSDGYTDVGTLIDARDGTSYVIRKYADGRCWMAENLKFGQNCKTLSSSDPSAPVYDSSKVSADYNGVASETSSFTGYVGTVGSTTYVGACVVNITGYDGYLYNWEAAMNNITATYNGSYDRRVNGTTLAAHDICPMGWHVPTGGASGEFHALADAVQGGRVSHPCDKYTCATAYNFFNNSSSWNASSKSILSGRYIDGSFLYQGANEHIWSSTWWSAADAFRMAINQSGIYPDDGGNFAKFYGFSVRCVLDN